VLSHWCRHNHRIPGGRSVTPRIAPRQPSPRSGV
jgi:hypothetical protein